MSVDEIRNEEASRIEREIALLDNVRWQLQDCPERMWEVVTKLIEGRARMLNDLFGRVG